MMLYQCNITLVRRLSFFSPLYREIRHSQNSSYGRCEHKGFLS